MEQQPAAASTLFTCAFPLVFFTIFFIRWLFPVTNTTPKHLPPSPLSLPIIGNLLQLGPHPHRSLQRLAQRHGELMLLHFGLKPVLIASSLDSAREIMKTNDLIFSNRPKLSNSDRLLYRGKDVAAAPYGEYWRKVRSICVLQLLSTQRVQSFRAEREQELNLLIHDVKQSALLALPVNLSQLFASLTMDLICRAAFGRKYSNVGGGRFKELLGEFMRLLGGYYMVDFIPWLAWIDYINGSDAKIERVAKEFDEFLDVVVDEHMDALKVRGDRSVEDEDGKDFVDVLLEVQNSGIDGSSIDRDSIKGIILDMFFGGTDTTYTVLEWAMTEILRHPRVLRKLQYEVMEIAKGESFITESDLEKMDYLKAVIKETLRLHPPIPLHSRESTEDVKIMGYDIPAKTMVLINAWAIGRDLEEWDEPDEFQPDRFMNSSVDFKGHNFQLLPFGAGRRGCPGILFAMTTIELVLANIVHKFDWELPAGTSAEDISMTESSGTIAHRKVPLVAVAKMRCF